MTTPLTGGCMCGAVRYECAAEPVAAGHCHCRDCQRASGGTGSSAIAVPEDAMTISGAVKFFDVTNDRDGTTSRAFCPECGSRLFGKSTGMPGLTTVMAGSLDDPSRFEPGMEIYTSSAQPWDRMNPDLPKFPKMPEMPGM